MSQKIKVIQCGLGRRGSEMVRIMLERKKDIDIIGAVSLSGRSAHKDLGQVVGLDRDLGILVSGNVDEVCRKVEADVLLDATVNDLGEIFKTTRPALETGKNVISIGGGASFARTKRPDLAREIDEIAKKNGVTFLGTGINPGFMLDYLPIVMTTLMWRVEKFTIHRIIESRDASQIDWQAYGYGLSINVYNDKLAKGEIILFEMKATMETIARALGWKLDDYKQVARTMVSKYRRIARSGIIEPGTIYGMENVTHGFREGKEIFTIIQTQGVGINLEEDRLEPGTSISIEGIPGVELSVKGGQAMTGMVTSTHAVNCIPQVVKAQPGFLEVYELPPSPCFGS